MDKGLYISQLDAIISEFKELQKLSKHSDLSDLPEENRQKVITRAIAAIHRISGEKSTYSKEVDRILKHDRYLHIYSSPIMGVAEALQKDIVDGYTQTITEIIHGEVFSDFLEMAEHLNRNGFKDPAAVLAGSTLESHLMKLAEKNGISIEIDSKPIKAERLNTNLRNADVYSLLDQKNITAWLDLRNNAAHGKHGQYNHDQVALLISSIQDFITRHPA